MVTKVTNHITYHPSYNLKLPSTNGYHGNNPHNTNHSSSNHQTPKKLISVVMVSLFASSVVDREFELQSGQTKPLNLLFVASR